MKTDINPYEKMLAEGRTSLRPEEIKAYGVQRFLDEQAKRGRFQRRTLRSRRKKTE